MIDVSGTRRSPASYPKRFWRASVLRFRRLMSPNFALILYIVSWHALLVKKIPNQKSYFGSCPSSDDLSYATSITYVNFSLNYVNVTGNLQ
jgi:hypothetical protein